MKAEDIREIFKKKNPKKIKRKSPITNSGDLNYVAESIAYINKYQEYLEQIIIDMMEIVEQIDSYHGEIDKEHLINELTKIIKRK